MAEIEFEEDESLPSSLSTQEEEIEDWDDEEEDSNSESHSLHKDDFFGCYLLVSKNPQFKGRTYIGYTVNPKRRIRQHNAGKQKGGARRTSGRGPWEMILIVHGFPNDVSALRFEWAWQHPAKSRRLGTKIGPNKKSKESALEYRFRILSEMLVACPWRRLPLTVRWLQQEYALEFPLDKQPPVHMPIAYGQVELTSEKKKKKKIHEDKKCSQEIEDDLEQERMDEEDSSHDETSISCCICQQTSSTVSVASQCGNMLQCYHSNCSLAAHVICLAEHMCPPPSPHLIPTIAPCPSCKRELLWGELVRRSKENQAAS